MEELVNVICLLIGWVSTIFSTNFCNEFIWQTVMKLYEFMAMNLYELMVMKFMNFCNEFLLQWISMTDHWSLSFCKWIYKDEFIWMICGIFCNECMVYIDEFLNFHKEYIWMVYMDGFLNHWNWYVIWNYVWHKQKYRCFASLTKECFRMVYMDKCFWFWF